MCCIRRTCILLMGLGSCDLDVGKGSSVLPVVAWKVKKNWSDLFGSPVVAWKVRKKWSDSPEIKTK